MFAPRLDNGRAKNRNQVQYKPHKGFIGKYEVDVANYIFKGAVLKTGIKISPKTTLKTGYTHSQSLVETLLGKPIQEHFLTSQRLTKFLKKRDLTFQKSGRDGVYKIFTVPVTTTVVPLAKSVFNDVEKAAQVLLVSLRKVLQSIYGAESIRESAFVKALPEGIQQAFLTATESSPHYFSQLHHPQMQEYPFFDNVGLDLVLVQEYFQMRGRISSLIKNNRISEIPELPFRILELNAGSPSGASNNASILEGILREDPEILTSLGKVLPNNHFEVLRETYRSLGEGWTGRKDGVQILLPPGGENGAAPEIHELAAYSGLIYCDSGQLFCDSDGWIRMRTVDGSNPVVTAIYSRVNSDSVLFDKEKNILLRNPETGEPIYCVDVLKPWKNGKPEYLRDDLQNPIPLESNYEVPGALNAILSRKLYLGGLNRLLDNKIILATLTEYAPAFFREELNALGLKVEETAVIMPPECLPSNAFSLETIEKNPEDWVVKAPNLSGGTGVHILMTLDEKKRKQVLQEIRKSPESFAYQRVVKIGRIPVAVKKTHKKPGYRFANLAADIRMWVFYGANDTLPQLTHNALVRYAPKERGPMSSIVNTSKGGGYAPFVVSDDLNSPDAISAEELAKPKMAAPFQSAIPVFAGAQIVQVANLLQDIRKMIHSPDAELYRLSGLLYSLKIQLREITSFLHPRSMEAAYSMIEIVENRTDSKGIAAYFFKMNQLQTRLVDLLKELDKVLTPEFYLVLDEFKVLNQDHVNRGYTYEMKRADLFNFGLFSFILRKIGKSYPERIKKINRLRATLKSMIGLRFPNQPIHLLIAQRIDTLLNQFCELTYGRLKNAQHSTEFADLFLRNRATEMETKGESVEETTEESTQKLTEQNVYRETFIIPHQNQAPRSATEWEMVNGVPFSESEFIEPDIREARLEWLKVLKESEKTPVSKRNVLLRRARTKHFLKYPRLAQLQKLIDQRENHNIQVVISLMSVLPYAAYNFRQFAIEQKVSFFDLFTTQLTPERICILDRPTRIASKLNLDQYSGECFAKKQDRHGLISKSDRYMWIAKEQSPFIQLYTIGHELIHAAQIKEVMQMEVDAQNDGSLAFARFLNYYGKFLSLASKSLESHQTDLPENRKPVFGFADRVISHFFSAPIRDIRDGLARGGNHYDKQLSKYGSLFGYMMPTSNSIRVKALREVVPALENAKNIIFAKECGLEIPWDEVQSALPTANKNQVKRHRSLITESAKAWQLNFEALRVIASHQYYGVMFSRARELNQSLAIESDSAPIYLNIGYNQTQQ